MVEGDNQPVEGIFDLHRSQMRFSKRTLEVTDDLKIALNTSSRTETIRRSVESSASLIRLYSLNPKLTLEEVVPTLFPHIDNLLEEDRKLNTENDLQEDTEMLDLYYLTDFLTQFE